jgi:hypothetical protein
MKLIGMPVERASPTCQQDSRKAPKHCLYV